MSEPKGDEDWRAITENMSTEEKYQYMRQHGILTDCTFVVGFFHEYFKAHRVYVARESAVFEAMLLRGKIDWRTGHVKVIVNDLSPNTFQLLLDSVYGKDPEMTTFQEAQHLAVAAHKYQMKALLEICITRICALISPENIWTAYKTADLLQNKRLKQMCVQVLQCDTLRCVTDAGFMQASEENVALLLEQDELNVDDELLLVIVIVHWARHAARQRGLSDDDSGVRAVLEPRVLSLFRLLAMSPQQFMLGPGLAGWLTSDEKATISECLRTGEVDKLPEHLSAVVQKRKNVTVMASTVQTKGKEPSRNFICKREIIASRPNVQQTVGRCCLHRFGRPPEFYYCVHPTLIFKVNASCKWLGFQCASRCRADSSADPTAFLDQSPIYLENMVAKTHSFNHTLSSDFDRHRIDLKSCEQETEYNSTITFMFDEPVDLVPNNWFEVEVIFRHVGKRTPEGEYPNPSRASSVRTAAGVEFEFHTEELEDYHNSEYDGIFESLIFSL